jgi:hypothetical protein
MNQDNGGIIGKLNTPTTTVASGVWTLQDQFEAQTSSIWPLAFPQITIANACRFDDGSSDYFDKSSYATSTSTKQFTWSCWFKIGETPARGRFFDFWKGSGSGFSYSNALFFTSSNELGIGSGDDSNGRIITNRVFRDPSAWYHVVAVYDSPNSTAADRLRLYVNGERETSFSASVDATQNWDYQAFTSNHGGIGTYYDKSTSTEFFDGYMAEVIFIDGQALDQTSFGVFNTVSNIWEPRGYAGTYGNNGFRLDFANSSALGNDVSGNDNDFTANNLTSIDQATDTCSNNFATMNPLHFGSASVSNAPLSNGNNTFTSNESSGVYPYYFSTMAVSQGKWYAEFKYVSSDSATAGIGNGVADQYSGNNAYDYSYYYDGRLYNNGSGESTGYSAISNNDILGCALDLDNNKIYFHINGSYQASGDPANNTGGKSITAAASNGTGVYHFEVGDSGSTSPTTIECNFGSPPYTISSGNADANGFGNFEYSVPSGYFSLCTKNLAEFG